MQTLWGPKTAYLRGSVTLVAIFILLLATMTQASVSGAGAKGGGSEPPTFSIPSDGEVLLKRWLVSFSVNPAAPDLGRMSTAPSGTGVGQENIKPEGTLRTRARVIQTDDGRVDFRESVKDGLAERELSGSARPMVRAEAVLESATERDCYLLFGGSGEFRIWLNEQSIKSAVLRQEVNAYDFCIQIHLRPGANRLVVESSDRGLDWGIMVNCVANKARATSVALAKCSYILNQHIVRDDQPITWRIRGAPAESSLRVTLRQGDIMRYSELCSGNSGQIDSRLLGDKNAVCVLSFMCGDISRTEPLVYGSPDKLLKEFRSKPESPADNAQHSDAQAQLDWCAALMSAELYKPHDLAWQREVASALANFTKIAAGQPTASDLRVVGFRSRIDGSLQYYRFAQPLSASQTDQPASLAVIMPTVITKTRPFLSGSVMASYMEAQRLRKGVDTLNLAIVWPGYRAAPSGMPIDQAHCYEVIEDCIRRFGLADDRVFLVGVCTGARFAAMLDAKHPHRFSGMAFYNPEIRLHRILSETDLVDENIAAFSRWRSQFDPSNHLQTDYAPCLLVFQDDNEDHPGDREGLEIVASERQAHGHKTKITNISKPEFESAGLSRLLKQFVGEYAPPTIKGEKFIDRGSGRPEIASIFGEKFSIVTSSAGNDLDSQAAARIAARLADEWNENCHGEAHVSLGALDTKLKEDENLVIVGDASDPLVRPLLESNGISIQRNSVKIGSSHFEGSNLSIHCAIEHPYHPGRTIALVTAASLEDVEFGVYNLAIDGWYGFAVWSNIMGYSNLVAARGWED